MITRADLRKTAREYLAAAVFLRDNGKYDVSVYLCGYAVEIASGDFMNLFQQFRRAEKTISTDQGQFHLFGLFERDDVPNKYDVVVSALWLPGGRLSLMVIAELVRNAISNDTWWPKIGKFVVLPASDPFVKAVLSEMPNGGVLHDIKVLNDLPYEREIIKNAVIITAQKHPVGSKAAVAA